MQSEISLSTISEEPPSYKSSHEIVVQPELVVETTTVTNTGPHQIPTQTTSHIPDDVSILLFKTFQIYFFIYSFYTHLYLSFVSFRPNRSLVYIRQPRPLIEKVQKLR